MQQIADWLEKLGMSEYAQRFAENDIDFSVLRHLTDQDLKEHRRLARASAKDAAAIGELAGAAAGSADSLRRLSRSPKTPPSAAKSR